MENGKRPRFETKGRSPRSVVFRGLGGLLVASVLVNLATLSSWAQTSAPRTAPTVPPSATIPKAAPAPAAPRRTVKRTTRRVTKTTVKAKTTKAPADGTFAATVTGAGPRGVAVREAPAVTAKLLSRQPEGTTLRVACEAAGEAVKDLTSGRTSGIWVRLSSGGFVASIYTTAFEAGDLSGARKLPACASDGSAPATIAVSGGANTSSGSATATTKAAGSTPVTSGVVQAKAAVSTVGS